MDDLASWIRTEHEPWGDNTGDVHCTQHGFQDDYVAHLAEALAAVVSSPERDGATGLSRSDTNEASSPATPGCEVCAAAPPEFADGLTLWHDSGHAHMDRTGVHATSPATPEGECAHVVFEGQRGRKRCIQCGVLRRDVFVPPKAAAAPSTLPAETREGREGKGHHPKCFQRTYTPEQLVAEGLAADQCDCGTLRLLDAVTTETSAPDLSSWMETPHRIAVDAKGYVWRAYTDDDHWSMAPVNPDNSPIPAPVTYYVPETR